MCAVCATQRSNNKRKIMVFYCSKPIAVEARFFMTMKIMMIMTMTMTIMMMMVMNLTRTKWEDKTVGSWREPRFLSLCNNNASSGESKSATKCSITLHCFTLHFITAHYITARVLHLRYTLKFKHINTIS